MMKPNIGDEYTLVFDEAINSTSIHKGLNESNLVDANASFECLKDTMQIYLQQKPDQTRSANWIARNFEQIDGDIIRIQHFAISLVIVVTQGSLLLYFNNSDSTVSAGTMILLTIVYELFLGAPFYVMMHESFLRKRIRQVPVFSVAIERLNDQLQFLEQQKALIQTAETKLHEYKQKADLSESINPVFDAANAYIENLYTDNPVINTLLMYYASLYDRTGVQYSFELGTSTYTPIPDSLMIYIFSSLLDAAEQFFTLRFSRSANLYTAYACTGGRISDAQYLMLESLPSLSTDIDITCSTEKDDARKSVEIRFLVK